MRIIGAIVFVLAQSYIGWSFYRLGKAYLVTRNKYKKLIDRHNKLVKLFNSIANQVDWNATSPESDRIYRELHGEQMIDEIINKNTKDKK